MSESQTKKKNIIYSFVHIIKYSLVRIFDSESESKWIDIGIGMAISRDSAVHCAQELFFLLLQNSKWQNIYVYRKVMSTNTEPVSFRSIPWLFHIAYDWKFDAMHCDLLWKSWVPDYKFTTLQYLQMWKKLPFTVSRIGKSHMKTGVFLIWFLKKKSGQNTL